MWDRSSCQWSKHSQNVASKMCVSIYYIYCILNHYCSLNVFIITFSCTSNHYNGLNSRNGQFNWFGLRIVVTWQTCSIKRIAWSQDNDDSIVFVSATFRSLPDALAMNLCKVVIVGVGAEDKGCHWRSLNLKQIKAQLVGVLHVK